MKLCTLHVYTCTCNYPIDINYICGKCNPSNGTYQAPPTAKENDEECNDDGKHQSSRSIVTVSCLVVHLLNLGLLVHHHNIVLKRNQLCIHWSVWEVVYTNIEEVAFKMNNVLIYRPSFSNLRLVPASFVKRSFHNTTYVVSCSDGLGMRLNSDTQDLKLNFTRKS